MEDLEEDITQLHPEMISIINDLSSMTVELMSRVHRKLYHRQLMLSFIKEEIYDFNFQFQLLNYFINLNDMVNEVI